MHGLARGFSIIEVLVALAISAIVMSAVLAIADLSMRSGQLANRQTAFTEMSRGVRLLLDNQTVCSDFLRDPANTATNLPFPFPSTTPITPVGAVMMGTTPLAVMNGRLDGSDLTVTGIDVIRDLNVPVDPFVDQTNGQNYNRFYLNLRVVATTPPSVTPLGGKQIYTINFKFVGAVNATTGLMERCLGSQSSARFNVDLPDFDQYYSAMTFILPVHQCQIGNALFYASTSIACNRWCGGCGPTPGSGCMANLPGRGFTSGVATYECNGGTTPQTAQCVCFY